MIAAVRALLIGATLSYSLMRMGWPDEAAVSMAMAVGLTVDQLRDRR